MSIWPRSGEVVRYVSMVKKASGWYFKSARIPRTSLFFEMGQPEAHARVAYFLGSIERLLAGARDQTNKLGGLDSTLRAAYPSRCVRRTTSLRAVAGVLALAALTLAGVARAQKLEPPPPPGSAPTEPGRLRFVADPITDGAIISISFGFAALLDTIIGTEELRPQQPGPTSKLIPIDRAVVDDEPSTGWRRISNVGVGAAGVYAAADVVLTTLDEGSEAGLIDLIIYSETATITWALTNLAKVAVRRPRPSAYRVRDELLAKGFLEEDLPQITNTNAALSFFSGHASMAAALSTTATYLAFARSHSPTRGIVTAGVGGMVTTAVCIGRVKGGVHFPTDVVAGAMAGIGIGALVPHFHREGESKPVWVGVGPQGEDGVGLTVNGLF